MLFFLKFQVKKQKKKIVKSKLSQNYSSSEESDESIRKTGKLNNIGKSEQKNKIVRNIFLNVSKSDGGAKGKGQVMIVDHSEDSQKATPTIARDTHLMHNQNNTDRRFLSHVPIICKIDLARLSRIPNVHMSNNNNEKGLRNICIPSSVSIIPSKETKLSIFLFLSPISLKHHQ